MLPIRRNLMGEAVGFGLVNNTKISDLSTEVMGVGTPSVEAVVLRRDDNRQHLALAAAQGRWVMHECAVHIHGRL